MYGGDITHINRQALHCGELKFIHPVTNKNIEIASQIPFEMQMLID